MSTTTDRNIAAEARGVEEGHRAFIHHDDEGVCVKVVSDTKHDKWYRVTAVAVMAGDPIVFTCTPQGHAVYEDDHLHTVGNPGVTPCKHAALAARRLEREGLAEWAPQSLTAAGNVARSRWVLTGKGHDADRSTRSWAGPEDPFEGFPQF